VIQAVLDASALLALLLSEPGADKVRAILANSAVASVNLSEIVGYFARNGVAEGDIRLVLDPLPVARIPFDEGLAFAAGMLSPTTRKAGLSFGDRACLALATRLGVQALTADRSWQSIAKVVGVDVDVIR
jgi:PIN domain nuclease of toxin-antitoxin system